MKMHFDLLTSAFAFICFCQGLSLSQNLRRSVHEKPSPQTRPHITEEPEDVLVKDNTASYRLNCRAVGNPKPKISWFKDGVPFVQFAYYHAVYVAGDLVFYKIVNEGENSNLGVYQCLAQNKLGSAHSKNASVQIASIDDDFRLEPSDTVIAVGSTATIDCEGPTGFPKPVMSWRKNRSPLSLNERMRMLPTGSLIIEKLKKSDSGSYVCVATNVAGEVVSTSAVLMVKELPRPRIESPKRIVTVGQDVEVTCSVEGDPLARISWTKKGGRLSSRFSASNDGSMRITGVETEDEGFYVCTAENRLGKQSIAVEIKVQEEPVITSISSDLRVQIGDTVILSCRAKGAPNPIIMWRDFNGKTMFAEKSYQSGHILIDANGDLVLFSVRKDDQGVYSCQALNLAGTATADVRLNVEEQQYSGTTLPPPILSTVPGNKSVLLATTVYLNCSSNSTPKPVISWLKDDQLIEGDIFQPKMTTSTSGYLKISDAQLSDAGKYTCKASNKNGISEWNAWISVINEENGVLPDEENNSDAPSTPGKPILISSTSTSVTLSWSDSRYRFAIENYIIDYYRQESLSNSWSRVSTVPKSVYTVDQLLPSSSYIFVIRAAAQESISDPSPISDVIKTDAFVSDGLPDYPLNTVSIKIVNAIYDIKIPGVVTLEWNSSSGCDAIDGFLITARAATVPSTNLVTQQVTCSSRSHQLSHVVAGTKYEVRVRPYKGQLTGPASPIVFFSTSKGIISPSSCVLLLSPVENQPNAILFVWKPPNDLPASYVSGYELQCRTLDGDFDRRFQFNSSTLELTLTDFPSGATVEATLTYFTQLGVGTKSETETLRLPDDPITSFLRTPTGIIVISAAALVLLVFVIIIGVCCYRRSRRSCKSRSHRGSRTTGSFHAQGNANKDNGLSSKGDCFELQRVLQPGNNGANGASAIYYQNNEVPRDSPAFSYVTDQLISKNNLPLNFSRPIGPPQSSIAKQQRQVIIRQQSENCTNQIPFENERSNPAGYTGVYNATELPPPPISPLSTHKTGASDRSQSSSGVRSVSDKSSRSGQSSGLPDVSNGVTNRKPMQRQDVNRRLHGYQSAYQNTLYEETSRLNPPTPPIREESYDTNNDQCKRNYENIISTKLPNKDYPTNPQHYDTHNIGNAKNASWGNGNRYGSETDDRDSSYERASSISSGDESFEMESISQVGQHLCPEEQSLSYYSPIQLKPPPQRSNPYYYSSSDQEPLLSSTIYSNRSAKSKDGRPLNQHSVENCSNLSQKYHKSEAAAGHSDDNIVLTNSDSNGKSLKPKIPPSKNSGPSTLELTSNGQFSMQNEVPESLKLDINNALKRTRTRDGPSPSSPTESGVSEYSGYMSTASSCWQFQKPLPSHPIIQAHSSSNDSGRLPSSHYDSNGQKVLHCNNVNNNNNNKNNNNNNNNNNSSSNKRQEIAGEADKAIPNPITFSDVSCNNPNRSLIAHTGTPLA